MEPVQTKLFFDWMRDDCLQKLLHAFPDPDKNLYFVGGCVRNSLVNYPVSDIDIATPLSPEEIVSYLNQVQIKYTEIGRAHGTIMAFVGHKSYEITTFRRDIETDGRWAKVHFTSSLQEDSARRDFTINALYLTCQGDLYDFYNGREDLAQGRLQFIGNPIQRIREDYLRILRFFRFYAFFGQQIPDHKTLNACESEACHLAQISGERLRSEFLKMLNAPDPTASLNFMNQAHVTTKGLNAFLKIDDFKQLLLIESDLNVQASPLLRLYILFKDHWREIAIRFALSNLEKKTLANYAFYPEIRNQSVHYWLYYYGVEVAQAFIFFKNLETYLKEIAKEQWMATFKWIKPVFPLNGHDAILLGLQGPVIGQALHAVEKWWVAENFQFSRAECLKKLKSFC